MSAFSAKRVLGTVAAVAATAIALSGCAAPAPTYAPGDGVLKLGGVLPLTGALSFLSPPEIAGVDLAIKDINDAGGVLGNPVEWALEDSSDGDHAEVAPASATKLLASGVDAIVGAAASGVTRNIIDQITKAKVVQISMSNTAPDLSEWKDGGYYFRTAPSDLLQGGVVGNLIVKDGNENVGVIFQDTAYGQGLEKKAAAVIEAAGATVVAAEAFPEGESNFDTIVDKVIAAGADSVLVISYDEVKKIVPALQKKSFDGSKIYLVDGNLANFSDQSWAGYLTGAQGTLPGGETDAAFKQRAADLYKANYGKDLTEFAYLAESYDAVMLLALAAQQAGNDSGEAIMNNMTSVSTGGEKVSTFADGLAAIKAGKDIDYEGFSGPIEFDANGDPTGASIGIWKYVDGSGISALQSVVAGNSVK
ncbi:MAG: ABC transporter substrate-binding protein [Rhodoluna sp.]|nr:ABC transporter substrate-binding protein [Rhodoluna sp.]